jgi:O-antigen/teichoic acid export membrane protein
LNRTVNIAKNSKNINNSLWNVFDNVIYPLLFVISTPVFINYLGDEKYGLWMLLSSVIVVLHFFNFGLGHVLTFYIAGYIGSKKSSGEMNQLLNTILNISLITIPFLVLLGVLFYFLVLEYNLFATSTELIKLSAVCVFYAFSYVGFKLLQIVLSCALRGVEDFKSIAIFTTVSRSLALIINIYMAKYGYGLDKLLLVQMIINIMLCIVLFIKIRKHFENYRYVAAIDLPTVKKVRAYGFWIWGQSVIAIIAFQLDKFLGHQLNGLEIFGFYALASTMINQLHTVLGAIPSWIFPRISKYQAENIEFASLYFSMRSLLFGMAILGLLLLYFIRKPLLSLWLGDENMLEVLPFLELFIIYELFYVHTILPNFLLNGLGNSRYSAFYDFIYKSVIIGGMLVGFYVFKDIELMIVGMIVPLVVTLPVLAYFTNRLTLKKNAFKESFLIFIPSMLASGVILSQDMILTVSLLAATILSLIFVLYKDFSIKELLRE